LCCCSVLRLLAATTTHHQHQHRQLNCYCAPSGSSRLAVPFFATSLSRCPLAQLSNESSLSGLFRTHLHPPLQIPPPSPKSSRSLFRTYSSSSSSSFPLPPTHSLSHHFLLPYNITPHSHPPGPQQSLTHSHHYHHVLSTLPLLTSTPSNSSHRQASPPPSTFQTFDYILPSRCRCRLCVHAPQPHNRRLHHHPL